ncbi:MAG TPA: hypothetical protein VK348_04645 [Planctomycetota bacterium]|nr:hypothetical protein [Planctomycetota bacterium]
MAKNTKKVVPVEVVEGVEVVETGGMGIDEGIVLTTFLVLLVAIVIVIYALQGYPEVK